MAAKDKRVEELANSVAALIQVMREMIEKQDEILEELRAMRSKTANPFKDA